MKRPLDEVVLNEACLKAFARMTWMDEQDERVFGIRPVRPPLTAERLGIERYMKIYCKITGEDYEPWHDKITRMYTMMHHHDVDIDTRHVRQDIVDNFLYREYVEQLQDADAIRSYVHFAMYVSAKAVIAMLTEYNRDIGTAMPPKREDALRFKAREDYDETDPVWYLSHVFTDVPGTWEATQALQQMYGAVVRFECGISEQPVYGILPDDPIGETVEATEEEDPFRMEQATQAFLADEGKADVIATRYGIGQKRFRKHLKDNGLMKPHGGDRKGKRKK